jgi:hypothetical protein
MTNNKIDGVPVGLLESIVGLLQETGAWALADETARLLPGNVGTQKSTYCKLCKGRGKITESYSRSDSCIRCNGTGRVLLAPST